MFVWRALKVLLVKYWVIRYDLESQKNLIAKDNRKYKAIDIMILKKILYLILVINIKYKGDGLNYFWIIVLSRQGI